MTTATVSQIDVGLLLHRVRTEQQGFLMFHEVESLAHAPEGRLVNLLVRCGRCRFVCPAQDVAHLKQAVESVGGYVRDISLPVHEAQQSTITQAADRCVEKLNQVIARINVTIPNGGMQTWINEAVTAVSTYNARRLA